jgi:hypothetical protein
MAIEREFSRGMQVVFNALKDGKAHTRASVKATLAKNGIKKGTYSRVVRLGRLLRADGAGDIVITPHADDPNKTTIQMLVGAKAKKSIAEKEERYANLAGSHKSKKSSKKSAKKASTKKSAAVPKKKTAKKKLVAKKVRALADGGSEEEESASEAASSEE